MDNQLHDDAVQTLTVVPGVQNVQFEVITLVRIETTVNKPEERDAVYKAEMELMRRYPETSFDFNVKTLNR